MSDIFEFDDKARVERLVGTLHDPAATPGDVLTVQADKSIAAAPGAVVPAPVQAIYGGNNVSVTNAGGALLTWDTQFSGPALLDISTPATPTFAAAGTYAVTVLVTGDALTANGYAVADIATAGLGAAAYTQAPAVAGCSLSGTVVATQGAALVITAHNFDGVSSRNFKIAQTTIVKLA